MFDKFGLILCVSLIGCQGKHILDPSGQLKSSPEPDVSETRLRKIQPRNWVKILQPFYFEPVVFIKLGERVEIECEAIGSPAPEIHWHHPKNATVKTRNIKQITERTGVSKVKSRMVIDCVTRKHHGIYWCSAFSGPDVSWPELQQYFYLHIEDTGNGTDIGTPCREGQNQAPRIMSWMPTLMENMGHDVTLPCSARGSPAPTIYWLDSHNRTISSKRHKVSDVGDLIIYSLDWSDVGEYTCVAENAEGRDTVTTYVYPIIDPELRELIFRI